MPKIPDFPLFVHIVLTYFCNSKCVMCPYTGGLREQKAKELGKFMSKDVFMCIVDECAHNNSFLRITGGGEPLLHPEILDFMSYLKNSNIRAGIITNGSELNDDIIKSLLDANCVIELSVDGADKTTYERVRKGLSWEQLNKNIERLKQIRTDLGSESPIIVSAVNQKGVDIDYFKEYWGSRVDKVTIRKYLTWGVMDNDLSADRKPLLDDLQSPCPYMFQRITVDLDGTIRLCNYDIMGEISLGNVKTDGIKNVWDSDVLNKYRKEMINNNLSAIPLCDKCRDRIYRSWDYDYNKVVKDAKRKLAAGR